MRLIDAEDTINQVAMIAKALAKSDKQKVLCGRIIYMLEHRPTVKAIPLEVLEQIRAEVKQLPNANPSYWNTCDVVEREDVFDIIDEYRQEG